MIDIPLAKPNQKFTLPKDYATKKKPTAAATTNRRGSVRAIVVIALILAAGYYYLTSEPPTERQPVSRELVVKPSSRPTPAPTARLTTAPASVAPSAAFQPLSSTASEPVASPEPQVRAPASLVPDNSLNEVEQSEREQAIAAFQFYQLTQETPQVVDVRPPSARGVPLIPETRQQQFTVQAASFRSQDEAIQLRAELLLAGISEARVDSLDGNTGVWYRVLMGPLDSRSRANAIARQLTNRGLRPLVRATDVTP